MNFNNERSGEQEQSFDEWIGDSQFDDSADADHQVDLRVRVLEAFDQSQPIATVRKPTVANKWTARHTIGMAASLALCWFGLACLWYADSSDFSNSLVVEYRADIGANTDALLVDSLAEVDAIRDQVSRDVFFTALAACQQKHAARLLDLNATQMRFLYEASLPIPSVDSPKG